MKQLPLVLARRRARAEQAPVTDRAVTRLTRRLVRTFHPRLIILFGSRVYGTPRPDSDLDVLVVTETKASQDEFAPVHRMKMGDFMVDVHTRTPAELMRRLAMGDAFLQEVVARGRQVYPKRGKDGFLSEVREALERGRTQPMDNSQLVAEWVAKAEEDFEGAQTIARRRRKFLPNLLCWTCEQCVEKYLKAFLTRHRVRFERSHDLDRLYEQCLAVDDDFRLLRAYLDAVTPCTPRLRYPGYSVTEEQARAAFAATKSIRRFLRAKLGLRA